MPLPIEPTGQDLALTILLEVNKQGDADATFLVGQYLTQWQEKGVVKPGLLKLYAKRELLTWLLGKNALLIDRTAGDESQKLSGVSRNYELMRVAVNAEIAQIEKQVGSTQALMGTITAAVPSPSPAGRFPANSPYLLGDPNYPRFWRR